MWYFSRIQLKQGLDPDTLASAIPAHAYAEHQTLWQLFPDNADHPRDFLFRREQRGHWPLFYLLSARQPSDGHGRWRIETKAFRPQLHTGQRLAFSLRANPVRTRRMSDDRNDKRRRRDDVVMAAKFSLSAPQRAAPQSELVQRVGPGWLEERAERHGFAIESLQVEGYRQHRLYKSRQTAPIRFSTLDYQGVLCVRDPDALLNTLHTGVGPAKGFGCGLLLVRPAGAGG